jgi:homoserine kinase
MSSLYLRLPATSANLGPGFDTLALALNKYLKIKAREAKAFSIQATGRSHEVCGATERNLLIDVYRKTLFENQRDVKPLNLEVHNEIPLGMGCGSSAAVRLAGVALASHFGGLGWTRDEVLAEATRLEGHPDNAAACWMGGFVAGCWDGAQPRGSNTSPARTPGAQIRAVSLAPPANWSALIVLPEEPLATSSSRAVLPENYSRADVVANLQRAALLTAAFAMGREDLIAESMHDRLHQPYRSAVCPLLPRLLPLSGTNGVLGVALSGAGPAVLVLIDSIENAQSAEACIREKLSNDEPVEVLQCALENQPALMRSD